MTSFECEICVEEYDLTDRRPVVGNCGHTICYLCSIQVDQSQCPICRKVEAFQNAPTNYDLLSRINEQSAGQVYEPETNGKNQDAEGEGESDHIGNREYVNSNRRRRRRRRRNNPNSSSAGQNLENQPNRGRGSSNNRGNINRQTNNNISNNRNITNNNNRPNQINSNGPPRRAENSQGHTAINMERNTEDTIIPPLIPQQADRNRHAEYPEVPITGNNQTNQNGLGRINAPGTSIRTHTAIDMERTANPTPLTPDINRIYTSEPRPLLPTAHNQYQESHEFAECCSDCSWPGCSCDSETAQTWAGVICCLFCLFLVIAVLTTLIIALVQYFPWGFLGTIFSYIWIGIKAILSGLWYLVKLLFSALWTAICFIAKLLWWPFKNCLRTLFG